MDWVICYAPEGSAGAHVEKTAEAAGRALQEDDQPLKERLSAPEITQKIDAQREESRIHLLTLHGAKGTQFDHVWIYRCEEGQIPSKRGELEEERRLLYVGITRAREKVVLSASGIASQFLEEAGLPIGQEIPDAKFIQQVAEEEAG